MEALNLLLSDARGVYIPRDFLDFDLDKMQTGSTDREWIIDQLADPENDFYWDAWTQVLDNWTFTDQDGNIYRLCQDGDLWLYCEELMTDQEYSDFFGEERS